MLRYGSCLSLLCALATTEFAPQAYASNYAGHAKIDRLLFIAERRLGTPFGNDALRLAADELSQVGTALQQLEQEQS